MMEDDIGAAAGLTALFHVPYVALEKAEKWVTTARIPACPFDIRLPTGEKVVEDDDVLTQEQQGIDEVRADEAGTAGHDPPQRRRRKILAEIFVPGHGPPP